MRASSLLRTLKPRIFPLPIPPLRHSPTTTTARPIPDDPVPEAHHDQPEQQQQPLQNPQTENTTLPTPQTNLPPLIYPSAPSPHHDSLPTFLAYAHRTALDPSSTVYVGTHFEYTALSALARYGFALRRVGGASDQGIDLLGTWSLPSVPTLPTLRVLAQCKAVQRPGPHLIRELEGAFVGAPAGWRGRNGGVLGVLVTERGATKGIREALGRSRWPMGFVACSREGRVEQVLWNRRAEEEGLEGLGVGMRYGGGGAGEKELVWTWKGRNLPLIEEGIRE